MQQHQTQKVDTPSPSQNIAYESSGTHQAVETVVQEDQQNGLFLQSEGRLLPSQYSFHHIFKEEWEMAGLPLEHLTHTIKKYIYQGIYLNGNRKDGDSTVLQLLVWTWSLHTSGLSVQWQLASGETLCFLPPKLGHSLGISRWRCNKWTWGRHCWTPWGCSSPTDSSQDTGCKVRTLFMNILDIKLFLLEDCFIKRGGNPPELKQHDLSDGKSENVKERR